MHPFIFLDVILCRGRTAPAAAWKRFAHRSIPSAEALGYIRALPTGAGGAWQCIGSYADDLRCRRLRMTATSKVTARTTVTATATANKRWIRLRSSDARPSLIMTVHHVRRLAARTWGTRHPGGRNPTQLHAPIPRKQRKLAWATRQHFKDMSNTAQRRGAA